MLRSLFFRRSRGVKPIITIQRLWTGVILFGTVPRNSQEPIAVVEKSDSKTSETRKPYFVDRLPDETSIVDATVDYIKQRRKSPVKPVALCFFGHPNCVNEWCAVRKFIVRHAIHLKFCSSDDELNRHLDRMTQTALIKSMN